MASCSVLPGAQQHNCELQLGPVKVEAAKRQIFSLLLNRNPREQNRRKRKPAGKTANAAEVSDGEAPPPRGRGGKKGSRAAKAAAESSDASGAGTDSDTPPPPKRGRGGRRARQAAKAAAARSSSESDGDSETPPPPKKRRGGKRAGRAAEAAEQSEESDGEEYSNAQPPPQRGCRGKTLGRKAVRAAAADSSEEEGGQPARMRGGRRKAAAPAAPSSDEDVSDVEEAAGKPAGRRGGRGAVQRAALDSEGAEEAEPAPRKRGGRKQKAAQAEPEAEAEALDDAEQAAHEQPEQSKRKRDGRKQAAPKAAAGSAGEAAADAAADAAAEAAVGTKGRRGRPKGSKNKPKPKSQRHEDAVPGTDDKMEGGDSDAATPAQVTGQEHDLRAGLMLHRGTHLTLMRQQRWASLLDDTGCRRGRQGTPCSAPGGLEPPHGQCSALHSGRLQQCRDIAASVSCPFFEFLCQLHAARQHPTAGDEVAPCRQHHLCLDQHVDFDVRGRVSMFRDG